MKIFFSVAIILLVFTMAHAQYDSTPAVKKDNAGITNLLRHSHDHLLIQIGYDSWANKPDSIRTKGFSRSLNIYFMFDFPFKTDPRFSIGIGAGIGSSNIYFDKMIVDVAGNTPTLRFRNVSDTNYFKKYKISTGYLEAPVELRFSSNPYNSNKSFKVAVGVKVGTLLNVHTKGKNLLNRSGGTINSYIEKQNSKRYFNSNRFSVTARIGYGVFSVFGTYQINSLIKEGLGPGVRPYSVGLTISGL